jgi:hypothetical protein
MTALLLTPVALSFIVLAAHILRQGHFLLAVVVLFAPVLLITRQAWAPRVLQVLLLLGGLEWTRTAVELVRLRMAVDQPWIRMAVILGAVTVVTVASALALQHRNFRGAAAKG